MTKRNTKKTLDDPRASTGRDNPLGGADAETDRPDFVAAGAADLRRRAAACRVSVGGRACRRLEAAADLLDPPADDDVVEPDRDTDCHGRNAPAEPITPAGATRKADGEPATDAPPPEPDGADSEPPRTSPRT